jgi:elongation factor 1-gamma
MHAVDLHACFVAIFMFSSAKAQADLGAALQLLQDHLNDKTYLVNDQITLADIVLASTLLYPFKMVCDKAFLGPYSNVVRWFQACVNQPQFAAVVGKVDMCEKSLAQ